MNKHPVTAAEKAANAVKQAYIGEYEKKREANKLTQEERTFAGLLASGRIAHSYNTVAVCNRHGCNLDSQHLETCSLFTASGAQPHEWLWVLRDKERDLYDHDEMVVETVVSGIKIMYA
jgi:hypothetical protein